MMNGILKGCWRSSCLRFALILIVTGFIGIGCSSSGGDDNPAPAETNTPASKTITGKAAAGAPIVGIVNVKGVNGNTASSPIELDGSYNIDVTELTAPYILHAEGTVNGSGVSVYSAGVEAGPINITPITDFIVRNALAGDPVSAYTNWSSVSINASSLDYAESKAKTQLILLLTEAGINESFSLMSSPFNTDSTGIDFVLETLSFTYDGNNATVTNNLTGSQFVDDITTTADDTNGLPSSDENAISETLQDSTAISSLFQLLENLYADTMPTSTELDQFAIYLADDYLDEGMTKTGLLNEWALGEGPEVGCELSAVVLEPCDVNGTEYQKGYWVRIFYTGSNHSESFRSAVVYNGANWLWWGDRAWMEVGLEAHGFMSASGPTFQTGFEFEMDDDNNYAYNQGVRTAIVIGPGLPSEGLLFEHQFPETGFKLYPLDGTAGVFYDIGDDALIASITNGAKYTFILCSESASALYSDMTTYTALEQYTANIGMPPITNAQINASMFASLTTPASNNLSDLNFGGDINFSWTVPTGMVSSDVFLLWSVGSSSYGRSEDAEGSNSIDIDTAGLPGPDSSAMVFIRVEDAYGRDFNMGWNFY